MHRPDIFDFDDYRVFLAAWFAWRKAERESRGMSTYSHRMFAAEAGLTNVGILVSVINGERHLTDDLQQAFQKPLELNEAEAQQLALLSERAELGKKVGKAELKLEAAEADAAMTPSKTNRRRAEVAAKGLSELNAQLAALDAGIVSARRMHRKALIPGDRYAILASWSSAAIVELARCPAFRWDPAWIARALGGGLSADEVAEALEMLEVSGLLQRSKVAEDVPLVTPDEVPAQYVRCFYDGLHARAGEALRAQFETPGYAERCRLGALTIAVPASAVPRLREVALEARRQLFAALEGFDGPPEVLYQVWLHVFPVTEVLPSGCN